MNFDEYIKNELEQLEEIAYKQGNSINLSIILIALKPKDNNLQDILNYFEEKNIKVISSDIEPDGTEETQIDNNNEKNIIPFDPSKIDIKMDKMTIDSIIKRVRHNELDFDTDFQRKSGLWNIVQKSQLIESILLRIPLPAFYFDASDDDKWLIIDGLQRVGTLKEFTVDKSFELRGMEFLVDLNGLNYDELPRSFQRRIEETNVNAYLVNPATPANVKYNIFKRINTGGLVLEPQEIRNALYQGKATKLLKELSNYPEFVKATGRSIKTDRMLDREFCLRYVAFTYLDIESYTNIEEFLNQAMTFLNESEDKVLNEIRQNFRESMIACYQIFERYAFRKMAVDNRKRPINKAVFEVWSHITYMLDKNELEELIGNKFKVRRGFIELCEDYYFLNSLKASDRRSIKYRIERVEVMVGNILGGEAMRINDN